jgi:hypothetical protein
VKSAQVAVTAVVLVVDVANSGAAVATDINPNF